MLENCRLKHGPPKTTDDYCQLYSLLVSYTVTPLMTQLTVIYLGDISLLLACLFYTQSLSLTKTKKGKEKKRKGKEKKNNCR